MKYFKVYIAAQDDRRWPLRVVPIVLILSSGYTEGARCSTSDVAAVPDPAFDTAPGV